MAKPKILLYPKDLVDKIGIDGMIKFIADNFGYKMKLKQKLDYQYLFEEI